MIRHLVNLAQSNITPRLLVGALIGWFLCSGLLDGHTKSPISRTYPLRPAVALADIAEITAAQMQNDFDNHAAHIVKLAETDHVALLTLALENYQRRVQAFTGTFHKQERINGKLKPVETIAVQFKEQPFSLLMQWRENAGPIDKLLYVEGSNDDQMIVHPAGLFSWIKSVKRDPIGSEARKSSRRTCNQFGFRRTMTDMIKVYEQAQAAGDLQMVSLGRTSWQGRDCVTFERHLPPKDQYPCARMVVEFDLEYLLPVAVASYDWRGDLLARYTYSELDFNTTLTGAAFSPAANGL